ncbi:hypothetical protein [Propionibacterium australiense]|uniref:Uncharacterized protein n=1 Tax=Propionibacterium australiense TaxID=119981 RepID=A0A383S5B8_9ACTN|nr:hypothetical protein [Propionibacterium australiense]SYZ32604.1 Hypothetical protein PROPAUS_0493 [Propionibacterium australiense]VEH91645.1 Uncharacterised protein [Propionibacterium australiense]
MNAVRGERSRSELVRWSAIGVALLLVAILFTVGVGSARNDEQQDRLTGGVGSESVRAVSTAAAPGSGSSMSTDVQAYSALSSLADAGWASIQPVQGQWTVQVGIHLVLSPNQPAARPSGKATVDSAPVVLAEYESLADRFAFNGTQVLLVRRSAYGPAVTDDQYILVTLVVERFGSEEDAQNWCDGHYSNLAQGADRDAACSPTQLQRR